MTPTLAQVQGYVSRCRENPAGGFTDEQLKEYAMSKNQLPPASEPNVPYVVKWDYKTNEDFFVLWSTEKLLDK